MVETAKNKGIHLFINLSDVAETFWVVVVVDIVVVGHCASPM